MNLFAIVGSGGFGREVMPLVSASLEQCFLSTSNGEIVFVDESKSHESFINGYRVISMDEFIFAKAENKYFNIAIASFQNRKRIAEMLMLRGCVPFSIQAQNSILLTHNQIGEGAIFCPFTMVTANATIGKFFHANIYSYIAHDCVIGDYVTFAPNVHCNGNIIIEDDAYIGTGAMIKQGLTDKPLIIGKGAVVGMGAVVTKDVPPFTTVVGNPAKPLLHRLKATN